MHIYNKIYVLIITFFSYMFRHLLRHLQGELLCKLKIIITFCDYTGLQHSYSYLKKCLFQSRTSDVKVLVWKHFKNSFNSFLFVERLLFFLKKK